MVAINANDPEQHPEDHPQKMKAAAEAAGYTFPYLFDASQATAKAFRAACTPDIFLFDKDRKLAYRGQFDDSRPGKNAPVTGRDLRAALEAVLAGETRPGHPDRQHRLQHQVEAGQRAGLLRENIESRILHGEGRDLKDRRARAGCHLPHGKSFSRN